MKVKYKTKEQIDAEKAEREAKQKERQERQEKLKSRPPNSLPGVIEQLEEIKEALRDRGIL